MSANAAGGHHFLIVFDTFGLMGEGGLGPLLRAERATASGASQRERSERELAEASGRVPEARD